MPATLSSFVPFIMWLSVAILSIVVHLRLKLDRKLTFSPRNTNPTSLDLEA